ncbi:MAG: acetate kinase [Lyngbya sp. HA4199-MV5]|jgi:acetate kinase|nr:acetate kinase [Lyngbya sp. HA4199-MV5]
MKILILNAGSSSQKSCLYEVGDRLPELPPEPLWDATVDWTHHQGTAEIKVKTADGAVIEERLPAQQRSEVMVHMLETLWTGKTSVIDHPSAIDVVGHRVVHGGQEYRESVRVTAEVKATIDRLAVLAPVHNPANLEGIEAIERAFGTEMPQIAAFDTAFHSQLPDAAAIYPGTYQWIDLGIRRYGFHGISHQYCAHRVAHLLQRDLKDLRLMVCHLGNGCSLSAIQYGHSIDTTMGFTPLEGLMMGTRSGSVDPGILLYLMRQEGYTVDRMDQELNKASGLLGISGVSADLRQVMQAIEAGNAHAQLAFDVYIHRLRSGMGSMLASLGGVDAIVFTAGVGENAAIVRSLACEHFCFMGLKLDAKKNEHHPIDQDIATADSTVRIFVIHTQEDWAIAQDCHRLLS